jgi:hypothetical protein
MSSKQRQKKKEKIFSILPFYFCLLPFAFCLFTFAFTRCSGVSGFAILAGGPTALHKVQRYED